MTDPARDVADLVAGLLRALSAADLAALAAGRARLAVVPVDAPPPGPPADRIAPAGHPVTPPADRTTTSARPAAAPADR
ncbi:hypothetical protein AB0G08_13550, partial [Micromonospora sp. NPDC023644]